MSDDEQYLRQFYEIMGECGMIRPPWEAWRAHATENAQLWPIGTAGKMIGGVLWKGHTVHIAVLPQWQGRWLRKAHLAAWKQFTHECDIYATPMADNQAACRLAERLGFERQGPSGQSIIYVKPRTVQSCLQP